MKTKFANSLIIQVFDEGWCMFKDAYMLQAGEILQFTFDMKSHFHVLAFDRNGEEKSSTFPIDCQGSSDCASDNGDNSKKDKEVANTGMEFTSS